VQKSLQNSRVELRFAAARELGDRSFVRHGYAVRTVSRHGNIRVHNGDDTRRNWN
jgi:hypothetical protein